MSIGNADPSALGTWYIDELHHESLGSQCPAPRRASVGPVDRLHLAWRGASHPFPLRNSCEPRLTRRRSGQMLGVFLAIAVGTIAATWRVCLSSRSPMSYTVVLVFFGRERSSLAFSSRRFSPARSDLVSWSGRGYHLSLHIIVLHFLLFWEYQRVHPRQRTCPRLASGPGLVPASHRLLLRFL